MNDDDRHIHTDSDHWLTQPETIRGFWIAGIAALVLSVAVDVLVKSKGYFGIDGTIGFGAWFGFLSCVVLVVVALGIGLILQRRDTYYDE